MSPNEEPAALVESEPRDRRCLALLVLLIALIMLIPLSQFGKPGRLLLMVLYLGVMLAGLRAMSYRRRDVYIGLAAGAPLILGVGYATFAAFIAETEQVSGKIVQMVAGGPFTLYVLIAVARHVYRQRSVTADHLFGAACVYLLLGLTWASAFALCELIHPGSFTSGGVPIEDIKPAPLLYFSYVTLTTLGYGDITPASSPARSLAVMEAVAGVFYLTVLVARMVSQYEAGRRISVG